MVCSHVLCRFLSSILEITDVLLHLNPFGVVHKCLNKINLEPWGVLLDSALMIFGAFLLCDWPLTGLPVPNTPVEYILLNNSGTIPWWLTCNERAETSSHPQRRPTNREVIMVLGGNNRVAVHRLQEEPVIIITLLTTSPCASLHGIALVLSNRKTRKQHLKSRSPASFSLPDLNWFLERCKVSQVGGRKFCKKNQWKWETGKELK